MREKCSETTPKCTTQPTEFEKKIFIKLISSTPEPQQVRNFFLSFFFEFKICLHTL